MTYRVAIAGCHRMLDKKPANHNWASAFDALPETDIIAIFDRGADTRRAFVDCWGAQIPAYDDFSRMLQQAQPDILCVATRQTMHAEQIQEAVAAGIQGILSDKPLATSLTEADQLLDACRMAGVPLAFGLDRHWFRSYRYLAQLVADGIVGTVQSLTVYGLPNLINHGCHWYDAALLLVGSPEPRWVSGFVDDLAGEAADSRRHLDPPGRGQVGLEGEITVYFTPDGGRSPAFDVIGDQGRLWILDDARQAYLWQYDTRPPQELDIPQPLGDFPSGQAIVRDLVKAIASGGKTACDVEEARHATEIGFAFHLSHSQQGRRIVLPAAQRDLRIPSFPWGNE